MTKKLCLFASQSRDILSTRVKVIDKKWKFHASKILKRDLLLFSKQKVELLQPAGENEDENESWDRENLIKRSFVRPLTPPIVNMQCRESIYTEVNQFN